MYLVSNPASRDVESSQAVVETQRAGKAAQASVTNGVTLYDVSEIDMVL
jgi:hypothetical protein